jgi:ferredoxin
LVVHLDVRNSPVLFGCRTGLCGTCLARVEGTLPPPSAEEREVLDILAPGDTKARLLCQLSAQDDLCIEAIVP